MSKTPRVDAAEFYCGDQTVGEAVVSSDVARKLEIECAMFRAAAKLAMGLKPSPGLGEDAKPIMAVIISGEAYEALREALESS